MPGPARQSLGRCAAHERRLASPCLRHFDCEMYPPQVSFAGSTSPEASLASAGLRPFRGRNVAAAGLRRRGTPPARRTMLRLSPGGPTSPASRRSPGAPPAKCNGVPHAGLGRGLQCASRKHSEPWGWAPRVRSAPGEELLCPQASLGLAIPEPRLPAGRRSSISRV